MGFDWISPKNYKRHYICLNCQKGFKRPSKKDMKHNVTTDFSSLMCEYYKSKTTQSIINYIHIAYQKMKIVCPNCQNQMLQVHYNFEVPSQRDKKAWLKIKNTMSQEKIIRYDIFIDWHSLELQKKDKGSALYKKLKQNLLILEDKVKT